MHTRFKNKIIYQLALRTFTPEGTLEAAEKLLPHIQRLGFDIVYLTALCSADDDMDESFWSKRQKASRSGNPKNSYRMKDYFSVDEEYGTNEDLKRFIHTAHTHKLLVMLDLVYLHCGPKAVFLEEHPNFVKRDENGDVLLLGEWAFPRLNYENAELREYLYSNMEYFVRECKVDGFRCDVASKIPSDFWFEGVKRIKNINPNILMLNEGNMPEWIVGISEDGFFDADYSFCGHDALRHAIKGYKNAAQLREIFIKQKEMYHGKSGAYIQYTENHDTASDDYETRKELVWGHAGVECALVITHTIDGIPMVFNGTEVASACPANMFVNRFSSGVNAIQWSNALLPEGKRRLAFMRKLNAIHHKYKAISAGTLAFIKSTDEENIFAFLREYKGKRVVTVTNLGKTDTDAVLDISVIGLDTPLLSMTEYKEENGKLFVKMKAKGYIIFAD